MYLKVFPGSPQQVDFQLCLMEYYHHYPDSLDQTDGHLSALLLHPTIHNAQHNEE